MNIGKTLYYTRVLNTVLCFFGLLLSMYSVFIEWKHEVDKDYVAFCDINEVMSCSKAFNSKFAKGFGLVEPYLGKDHFLNLPNGILGIITYTLLLLLSQLKSVRAAQLQRVLVLLCNCMTPYLAYLLYKVIKSVCVVCVSTYVVNALLLLVAWRRMAALGELARKRMKKGSAGGSKKRE